MNTDPHEGKSAWDIAVETNDAAAKEPRLSGSDQRLVRLDGPYESTGRRSLGLTCIGCKINLENEGDIFYTRILKNCRSVRYCEKCASKHLPNVAGQPTARQNPESKQ